MTIKSKITSVEYQESVSRAIKNSKNPKQTPVRKSPYTMKNLELKKIVKEVLKINLVDWLTKSQIQLIELELEVAGIDSEQSINEFIFNKSVTFKCSLLDD